MWRQCRDALVVWAVAAATLAGPQPALGDVVLNETFDDGSLAGWVTSSGRKGDAAEGEPYDGEWEVLVEDAGADGAGEGADAAVPNRVLMVKDAAKHYCISRAIDPPVSFGGADVVLQYAVRFFKPLSCGGAYIKLLSAPPPGQGGDAAKLDLTAVTDKTPYTILFGPDKCGADQYLRFIFRFKNPVTGEYNEVHARRIKEPQKLFRDKKTHLVTLVLSGATNGFEMRVDGEEVLSGKLGEPDRFEPALSPPEKIDDPEDAKPDDWTDEEAIDDPSDVKPADWVDEATVVDAGATRPEGWDEEMDGEWEPPTLRNPAYKGEWRPKRIQNPEFKGQWKPRQIANPAHFAEPEPLAKLDPVGAIAFELWTTTSRIVFDDVVITTDPAEADAAAERWRRRRAVEDAADAFSPYRMFMKTARAVWRRVVVMVGLFADADVFEAEAMPWIDAAVANPAAGALGALLLLSPFLLLLWVLCGYCCGAGDVDIDDIDSDDDGDDGDGDDGVGGGGGSNDRDGDAEDDGSKVGAKSEGEADASSATADKGSSEGSAGVRQRKGKQADSSD